MSLPAVPGEQRIHGPSGVDMNERLSLVAGLILAVLPACRLQRQHEFLQHQYQVRDVDNAISEQQNLEQEFHREMAHVNRLNAEVARLLAREEALALEKRDTDGRIASAQQKLGTLNGQLGTLSKQVADEKNLIVTRQKELETAKTPADRQLLEARIQQLKGEADRLAGILSNLPPPAPEQADNPPESAAQEQPAPPPKAPAPKDGSSNGG